MAQYPNNFYGKMQMRPGARGQKFDGDRINRSNHTLNTSAHEATNIKYGMDDRLRREFTYGYAAGYNQMLMTKGRVVAVDPYLQVFDTDTQKYDNALTLANGGVDVQFDPVTGHWIEATTPFALNVGTGKDNTKPEDVRPANIPIGIIIRNEYTRDYDAFNGITPGAVNTDCMTELPLFASEQKAKENPWGSAYGALKPGDLVKSDTTGRMTLSGLSDPTWLSDAARTIADIELERQQVIGQVYEVRKELVPMGAAVYAQWALSDILEFEEFNPSLRKENGRRGEDLLESSPYREQGKAPFGYDSTFNEHDLHMNNIEGNRKKYNARMQHRYRFDFGIPGLSDGYNAVVNTITDESIGTVDVIKKSDGTVTGPVVGTEFLFRILNTNIEKDGVTINGTVITEDAEKTPVVIAGGKLEVNYFNALQGVVRVKVASALTQSIELKATYKKRGQSGVPTHLDWDGCVGTVKVLLQK